MSCRIWFGSVVVYWCSQISDSGIHRLMRCAKFSSPLLNRKAPKIHACTPSVSHSVWLRAMDVTQIGYVYFGQSSSKGTATVKMPDTSRIKTAVSSILPHPFHRPPVCACGREECWVCTDFQSVEAADGPLPCAWRQPSVSWRSVATAIRTLCGGSNLFHHR